MRRYEVVFVLAPSLTEEEVEQMIETFTSVAKEKGAEIIEIDRWGKRRLAFPVKKHNEGYYMVLTLEESSGEAVFELERRFKVIDSVIRFLSVRIDQDLKRAEKFETKREARQKRRSRQRAKEKQEAVAEQE
ncbi:MAG TPA: 30S ribosomal protein S6 [Acidobacteriota bacterium]|nr:30S ribosomal protein S6 [Acidobacteriota bacterium]